MVKQSKKEQKPKKSYREAFATEPITKILLKGALPAMIVMLIFGAYTFADNILAINFANDEYADIAPPGGGLLTGKDQVRLFMGALSVVPTFMFSVSMLFGVGIGARYSINMGAKRTERAIKTANTTMQVSLITSLVLIPVLLLSAKAWVGSQFAENPHMKELISNEAYKYLWIVIVSFPLQVFNQQATSLLRAEGRNGQAMLAAIIPVGINLLFDWVFMGPAGMGIEGGAWATFISYAFTMMLMVYFIAKKRKDTNITFSNLFGTKNFKIITIVGVLLVGISPFLRNFAQSIIQTAEMREVQKVSTAVYGNNMQMSGLGMATFPVFGLVFPMLFGFIQAGSPIIGFNYGAKNVSRVRKTTILISAYSLIVGALLYVTVVFGLSSTLFEWLGVKDTPIPGTNGEIFHTLDKSKKAFSIMFISALVFAPILGGLALFSSTDRVIFNIIASSMRSLILFFPFLYGFSSLAQGNPGTAHDNLVGMNGIFTSEYLFWWFYPAVALCTAFILIPMMIYTFVNLNKEHKTLEDTIESINNFFSNKRKVRKSKNSK